MFRGVRKLPPAHTLTYDGTAVRVERYWEPPAEVEEGSEDAYAEQLVDALTRAVRKRLVADVPVGAFLSGGIDSSIIVGQNCGFGGYVGVGRGGPLRPL